MDSFPITLLCLRDYFYWETIQGYGLKVGLFVQIVTVCSEFQYSDICNTYKTKRTQSYHLLTLFISVVLQISELFRHCFFVKNDGWIHQDIIKWPLPDPYRNILLLPIGPMIFLMFTYREGHDRSPTPTEREKRKNIIQLQKWLRRYQPISMSLMFVLSNIEFHHVFFINKKTRRSYSKSSWD